MQMNTDIKEELMKLEIGTDILADNDIDHEMQYIEVYGVHEITIMQMNDTDIYAL